MRVSDFKLIDGHCHVASDRFIPEAFVKDVAFNLANKLSALGSLTQGEFVMSMVKKQHQDHNADELISEMDKAGIEATVLLAPDFEYFDATSMPVMALAKAHQRIKQRHPKRFKVLIGVDPRRGEPGIIDFESAVRDYQLDGLKLYPPCGYYPDDRSLYGYYEICAKYDLPVLSHTGPTAGSMSFRHSQPVRIVKAAAEFSNVNFILAHGGVVNVEESIQLCKQYRNIYMDIGGFTGFVGSKGWVEHLNWLFSQGCNHKIIFGTDWPIFKMSGGLEHVVNEFIDKVLINLKDKERDLITYGNISRILQFN